MIDWRDWQPLDDAVRERTFLQELHRETEEDSQHPLHGKNVRIVAWKPGEDDFILQFSDGTGYAYVHLTWNRERVPQFPHCQHFDDEESLNSFIAKWADPAAS